MVAIRGNACNWRSYVAFGLIADCGSYAHSARTLKLYKLSQ